MHNEEQDGTRFLGNGYGFIPAVQLSSRLCAFGFGHLDCIEKTDDDILEPVKDHDGGKVPSEKQNTEEGDQVEDNERSGRYSEHGYMLSDSMGRVNHGKKR